MTNSAGWSTRLVVYPFQPGQGAGFGLQLAVDALGRTGELDEPIAFHRGVPVDGTLGLGDLLIDPAQRLRARSWRYW